MDKKKIIIISRSFYPEQSPRSFRTTELVKGFARQGHEVTLVTLKKGDIHSQFEKENGIIIKDLVPLKFPSISTNNSNLFFHTISRALRRGLKLFFEYPSIELMYRVKKALELMNKNYDLLISIAVPHTVHWGVAAAYSNGHSIADVWAADCGDPYMGESTDSFRKMFYFKYVESWFCRKADVITVPIEAAKEAYYPEFRKKINVIPQGFDFKNIDVKPGEYIPNKVPTFAYAGSFIRNNRDPRRLLEYLVELDQDFRFVIYTKNRDLIKPFIKNSGGKIEIRDYIPRKELLKKLSCMDFLVNLENNTAKQQPSKLIDYYLAGRPVLSVGSRDIDKENIQQFLYGNYSGSYRFKDIERYRIENVCKKFLNLIHNNMQPVAAG